MDSQLTIELRKCVQKETEKNERLSFLLTLSSRIFAFIHFRSNYIFSLPKFWCFQTISIVMLPQIFFLAVQENQTLSESGKEILKNSIKCAHVYCLCIHIYGVGSDPLSIRTVSWRNCEFCQYLLYSFKFFIQRADWKMANLRNMVQRGG